jgi:hypothetical protein
MVKGSFAATRYSRGDAESGEETNLEELFFRITEGKDAERGTATENGEGTER